MMIRDAESMENELSRVISDIDWLNEITPPIIIECFKLMMDAVHSINLNGKYLSTNYLILLISIINDWKRPPPRKNYKSNALVFGAKLENEMVFAFGDGDSFTNYA